MERTLDVDLKTRVRDLESGTVSWATFEELHIVVGLTKENVQSVSSKE